MTFSCCCSSICHASRNQHPFFNLTEKFKKVCFSWLYYRMCTKGNVNPKYTALYFTLSLFQNLAVQHRLECYLNSQQTLVLKSQQIKHSLRSLSLHLSVCSKCMWLNFHQHSCFDKNSPTSDILGGLENIAMDDRLQRSGLNWDIPVYTHIHKCPAVTNRPTATPMALSRVWLHISSVFICTLLGKLRQNSCIF